MKKFFALFLAAALLLSVLSGCSAGKKQSSGEGQQEGETVYKVGIVQYVDDASLNQIRENLQARLDQRGQELGVTFDYAPYTYNGQADATTLNQIAAELIAAGVDCIVPIATPAAQIMQANTEEQQIPIVFSAVSDPVGAGLVSSLEAPGANITGTSDALNTTALMQLMQAADPELQYVGLLYSKSEDSSARAIADAKAYLESKNIRYIEKTGTNTNELLSAVDALIAEKVDAVFTPTDNTVMTAELSLYEKLAEAGIPHYAGADSFALNGAFCGYGVDYANLGAATADMVVSILAQGASPASTPVQTFDNGLAVVNTEICRQLGLDPETVKKAFAPYCTAVGEIQTAESFS